MDGMILDDPPGDQIVEDAPDGPPSRALHALLFVTVMAGRCAFSLPRSLFRLYPDEPGTFAMARWLSGRGTWDMGYALTWKPGMATLIAPLFWVTDDQAKIVQSALVIAAALGGLGAVLMRTVLARLTTLSDRATALIAGAVALSPSALASSAFVWAEPLVTVTFLATLLALIRFFDRPSTAGALVTIVFASAGYLSHSRMLPLVATVGFLTAGKMARDRGIGSAALALALALVGVAAADAYASRVYSALWTDPDDTNTVSAVASNLGHPLGILLAATGQLWYLLTSTAGVFAIGAAVLVARAARGADDRVVRDARLVIAATAPLIGLSVVFMSDRPRVDQQIYGRYNDAIVWPVIGIGVAWLLGAAGYGTWRTGRARLILFGMIGAAIIQSTISTIFILERDSVGAELVAAMVPGIAGLLNNRDRINVVLIGTIALMAWVVLAFAATPVLRHARFVGVIALLCLISLAVRGHQILGIEPDDAAPSAAVQDLVGPVLHPGDTVVYGYVPVELDPGAELYVQGYYAQLYQWYLPEIRFRVTERGDYPDNGFVFAPVYDRILVERGSCIVWRDPVVGIVLWDARSGRCEEAEGPASQQSPPD